LDLDVVGVKKVEEKVGWGVMRVGWRKKRECVEEVGRSEGRRSRCDSEMEGNNSGPTGLILLPVREKERVGT
jgi:hypothetical protein